MNEFTGVHSSRKFVVNSLFHFYLLLLLETIIHLVLQSRPLSCAKWVHVYIALLYVPEDALCVMCHAVTDVLPLSLIHI